MAPFSSPFVDTATHAAHAAGMSDHDDVPRPFHAPLPGFSLPALSAGGPGSRSGWQYTPALGERICDLLSDAPQGGLAGLHAAFPDLIPPVRIVRAWAAQWPAFGLSLAQAERVRAEVLVEQSIVVADTDDASPAKVALRISARQYLAERLDRARFGKTPADSSGLSSGGLLGHEVQPTAGELSDEELARLAVAGREAGAGG